MVVDAGTHTFHRWLQYLCSFQVILLCGISSSLYRSGVFERISICAALASCFGILLMESFAWRPFDYGQFPAAVGMGPFINPNHAGGFLILIHFCVFTGPRS